MMNKVAALELFPGMYLKVIIVNTSNRAGRQTLIDRAIKQVIEEVGPHCSPALRARIENEHNWTVI